MAQKTDFKLTLTGEGVKVNQAISREQGRAILNIVMGGSVPEHAATPGAVGATLVRPPGAGGAGTGQTANQFVVAKRPKSDMERVACLAWWLTNMKDSPTFKTKDIQVLSREACPGQLPDPRVAVNNASRNGYVAPAGGGTKQITTRGEELVKALPDREAVKRALQAHPMRRRRKRRIKNQQ